MEVVIQLLTRVPEGWPRVALVATIIAVLVLTGAKDLLFGARKEQRILDRARRLLEIRKLQLETDILRVSNPAIADRGAKLDVRIDSLVKQDEEETESREPPALRERLFASGLGGLGVFVLSSILIVFGNVREFSGIAELVSFLAANLLVFVAVATLAGLIPSRSRKQSVIRGTGLPIIIAGLLALIR